MEKTKIDMDSFITAVYEWTNEYRNRPVVDYHYSCMQVMKPTRFKEEIKAFIAQRLYQMYGVVKEDLPKGFIGRAATMYINDVL